MKRAVMWAFVAVLGGAFAYCGWRYYNEAYLPNKQLTDAVEEQRETFARIKPDFRQIPEAVSDSKPDSEVPANETIPDPLADLKAQNEDAVGWLTIDGTNIDYPIVQAADNSFYLQRGFDKKENYGLGCPFLDYRCRSDLSGFNSIIYAHHIKGNAAMFADIAKYKSSSFMQSCPTGTLLTENGQRTVRFFAYMTVSSDDYTYHVTFNSDTEKEEYLDHIFDKASFTMNLGSEELKKEDDLRLLLLSTCTYEYWEARGVLVGVIE